MHGYAGRLNPGLGADEHELIETQWSVLVGEWAVTRTVQRNRRAHAGERVNDDPPHPFSGVRSVVRTPSCPERGRKADGGALDKQQGRDDGGAACVENSANLGRAANLHRLATRGGCYYLVDSRMGKEGMEDEGRKAGGKSGFVEGN